VQGKLQGLSPEVDTRIVQQSLSNLEVRSGLGTIDKVDRLGEDIESVKVDLKKHTEGLGKRQGERLAQLHKDAKNEKSGNQRRFELVSPVINDLERKLAEGDTKTRGTEVKQGRGVTDAVHRSPTPSPVVKLDDNSRVGDVSYKCNLNSSTLCVNGSVIGESANEPERHHSKSNYLSYSDLPLPQLIYSSESKPILSLH
jgi:predicted nuclease with TOPRIM domain